jgi:hypothetical protein
MPQAGFFGNLLYVIGVLGFGWFLIPISLVIGIIIGWMYGRIKQK